MKQYALFAHESYYPGGGWKDFIDTFEHVAVAIARMKLENYPVWGQWHIVDLHSGRIVAQGKTGL